MQKNERYLKQVIVARKDLSMPAGKLAAMVSHAAMTFLAKRMQRVTLDADGLPSLFEFAPSPEEARWLTELDDGIEDTGQLSFAKIVLAVDSEEELLTVQSQARDAGLSVHHVIDSGYSHNKPGTLACIAIGPHWPEQLAPVTGKLKLYR